MRVLVVGASGAIGTRLVLQLIDQGHEVIETAGGTDEFRASPRSTFPEANDARLATAHHCLGAESAQGRVPGTWTEGEIEV